MSLAIAPRSNDLNSNAIDFNGLIENSAAFFKASDHISQHPSGICQYFRITVVQRDCLPSQPFCFDCFTRGMQMSARLWPELAKA